MTLRDLVTKDPGWKLLSVALAVAIWLTVRSISEEAAKRRNSSNGMATRTFQAVPVEVVSGVADVRDCKARPPVVQITFSGSPDTIETLNAGQIRALVQLTGIEVGRDSKKRVEVSLPPGFTLVSAVPPEVDVAVPLRKGK